MGLFESASYASATVPVEAGDVLVVFSDGVTEAVNAAGDEWGDARLAQCLDAVRTEPVSEILTAVERAVRRFCGSEPTRDDVTVMVVRIR